MVAILKLRLPLVDMSDVGLIYHFQSSTEPDFDTLPMLRPVRRLNLSREAPKYPFLLHGLLAASALHLQTRALDRRGRLFYKKKTLLHHQLALSYYKASLRSIDERTCHAIFAFSVVLAGLEFNLQQDCREGSQSNQDMSLGKICDIFDLLQGVAAVAETSYTWIQVCQIDISALPFLSYGHGQTENDQVNSHPILGDLSNEINRVLLATGEPHVSFVSTVVRSAVKELEKVYQSMEEPSPRDVMAIISWPARVGKGYISMVRDRHPAALMVLAYYGLAICPLDHLWWLNGIGGRLVKSVADLSRASCSRDWQALVAWPVMEASQPMVYSDLLCNGRRGYADVERGDTLAETLQQ